MIADGSCECRIQEFDNTMRFDIHPDSKFVCMIVVDVDVVGVVDVFWWLEGVMNLVCSYTASFNCHTHPCMSVLWWRFFVSQFPHKRVCLFCSNIF